MNNLYRKGVAIVIIALFAGSAIIPGIYANNVKLNHGKDLCFRVADSDKNQVDERSKIKLSFSFEKPKIMKKTLYNMVFSSVSLEDLPLCRDSGKPLLPAKLVDILLPPASVVKDVHVDKKMRELEGKYLVQPAGRVILMDDNSSFDNIFIDPPTYNSSDFYPGRIYEISGIGKFRGYSILSVKLYPVQYISKQEKLYYCTNITLVIETSGEKENNSYRILSDDAEILKGKVANPSMVDSYLSAPSKPGLESNHTYGYVIITDRNLENSNFQLLKDYKSQYVNARIVTVGDIIKNSSFWVNGTYGDATNASNGNPWIEDGKEVKANFSRFNDTAAKIRNFIRYAYQEWETEYVLLGGDVDIIPVRKLFVRLSDWYSGLLVHFKIKADIVSDLYYGSLHGTWNDDFDEHFGEASNFSTDDEADLFADVYIGRAPVDSLYEVDTFVHKVISYETSKKPKDVQLHQSFLTPSEKPDTTVIPKACAQWIPDGYNIHRLYEVNEKVTVDKWVDCFRDPSKLLVLHVGNGYFDQISQWYQLSWDDYKRVKFSNLDVSRLNNSFFPVHMSISCVTGDFSKTECLAEELLLWSRGGPSACLFNSEVGCVSENDALAYSGEYLVQEFHEFFNNETKNLGKVYQFAKEHFANIAYSDSAYRWCYYEINLLGDPETPVLVTRENPPVSDIVYVDDDFNYSTPGWNLTRFSKIQGGIDSVKENGIIYVYNGTYYENIVIGKTLDIIGENKHNTVIEGSNGNIVTIQANSSVVKNFTIRCSRYDQKKQNTTGVYIPPKCEGNEISNNIILENNMYGILIQGSCRNTISNNVISSNGYGIGSVNPREGLFENYFIITCDNIFSHNTIISSKNYGIYLEGSIHNRVLNNNFINNSGSDGLKLNKDAFFLLSRYNEWDGNYWNEPRSQPEPIFGMLGPIFLWTLDFSNGLISGLIFPHPKYLAIINIGIPVIVFDENPAQEPYEIV